MATLTVPDVKSKEPERSILAAVTTEFARYAVVSIAPSAILLEITASFANTDEVTTDEPKREEEFIAPDAILADTIALSCICAERT